MEVIRLAEWFQACELSLLTYTRVTTADCEAAFNQPTHHDLSPQHLRTSISPADVSPSHPLAPRLTEHDNTAGIPSLLFPPSGATAAGMGGSSHRLRSVGPCQHVQVGRFGL